MHKLPILMYHRIGHMQRGTSVPGHYVPPTLFKNHLRLLKWLGYSSTKLDRYFKEIYREKGISITFDDGYESFYSHALPLLKRHDFLATVFLVSKCIGQTNAWDELQGDVTEKLMNLEQVLHAQKEGMEFGSHTQTHAPLTDIPLEVARYEIFQSKVDLEEMLGANVSAFCYPYGKHSLLIRQIVKDVGYSIACSTEKGINTRNTDPYTLKRINVRSDTWTVVLFLKLIKASRAKTR